MTQRREFLKRSAALAVGGLLLNPVRSLANFPVMPKQAVGVQLFTLFSVMDEDVKGSLKKISAIGYQEIESAFSKLGGYYGLKPKEFAALAKQTGLAWKSHHVLGAPFKLPPGAKMPTDKDGKPLTIPPMRNLKDNMQELVDEAAEGGVPYLVCASIPVSSPAEIDEAVIILSKTGEACNKAGVRFAYHNHDAEFKNVEGRVPYDVFLSSISKDLMAMELDLCWVTKAGVDPVELFKKNPGRFPLWHVKDIDKDLKGPQPVGTGVVDFKRIFANAEVAGLKHPFVEHDMPADPYASLSTSYANLKKIIG
jgi:sugar phosphate isomerase/epimerase